jgi:hypothetical protein
MAILDGAGDDFVLVVGSSAGLKALKVLVK